MHNILDLDADINAVHVCALQPVNITSK